VAATDPYDKLAGYSDYGSNTVDLAAPGSSIFSCWNGSDSDYQEDNGTSMACAHVTGAVALLRAYYPGENYKQIIQRILGGTDKLPNLAGKTVTGGRLNLARALGVTPPPPAVTANFTANPSSGRAPLTVQFTDQSSGPVTSWNWNFGDGSTNSPAQNPSHVYSSAGSFTAALTVSGSGGLTGSVSHVITVASRRKKRG